MAASSAFDLAAVQADAQRKETLTDWGPGEFEGPLQVLLDDYARADLNAIGLHILSSGIVHSLRMRLRTQEWIRRHPEILEERVAAPIVVVGMMRSGTTLLQRLLAADPRFICAYGWEVVEVAPKLDYRFSDVVDPRIPISRARETKTRELAPDLFAIHPMYAGEAEEEIVFLADAFLSHVPESGAHLPHYRSWLDEQDFSPAYEHLHRMLQFVQWQKRQRCSGGGLQAPRWVLKSPAHLGYLDKLAARFPGLHVVHMHRDPRTTIASGASLNATLHAMHADTVDVHRVGAQWLARMGWTNDRAMSARDGWARQTGGEATVVTDIGYDEAVADPIGQVARVYDAIGLPLIDAAEDAMRRWLHERPREAARPPYGLDNYGLLPEQVDERFALYNKRFEQHIGGTAHA
ncbi:sulfotransferase family protein [Mycobacterium montefiorense]|uniref:Sulfotransferase n=1 Tax=Mycobacterium montefiorense TaxID=154654 RepID=A0AA37UWL9_9MYCO|nr:sulfotransferase [Mycobacterium montefiorense]GBG36412.1 putative sulfotransferase [Mycobacterium montefiorense]GKU37151.1 putative sulfotransferase [Mycobacterium montefiorense]GKU43333.1 putative sulfotransferase [Mycobacterium montefiorense]GKU43933.1 putative sulfotransferase [Mycobacterium montefiorense]GKU53692.1 putative sulfotransferase [Mycobacterium montefiorense]